MSETIKVSPARRLVESAIMVAIGTVLSVLRILHLPYGGSVTIACMLPVVIISFRHGIRWGIITGFAFGVLQQLLGLHNLSYVTTWQSIVAVILLDYIVAYMVQGFGGVFRKLSSQPRALMLGSLLVCILRFLCHVISGATVWAGLSIPTAAALVYSVSYNATYMIPETIVTCALAYYVGSILDFREENIGKMVRREKDSFPFAKWIAGLLLAAVVTFDVRNIFAYLQNAETGDFDITGLASVNWTLLGIVTLVCAGVAVCLLYVAKGKKEVA